jgi:hypothetical protein
MDNQHAVSCNAKALQGRAQFSQFLRHGSLVRKDTIGLILRLHRYSRI